MPLPAETRRTLSGIIKTMRDVPRSLIGDPAEVVHFLGRTARALERLRDEPVPVTPAPAAMSPNASAPLPAPSSPPRALSARERAEAVFRPATSPMAPLSPAGPAEPIFHPTTAAPPRARIVMDRKGRGVRVEVRRARAAGQMEMPI